LPPAAAGSAAARLDTVGLHDWLRERNVEVYLYHQPLPLLRVSAQLYNSLHEYQHLVELLSEALRGT
jgi:selenocysteine lyase/cysteine desulfurase